METNIDRLTGDILNLPREYGLMYSVHDQTISSKATADTDDQSMSKAASKINVLSLPAIAIEIYVNADAMDGTSLAVDELTVSVLDNANIQECIELKKKCKKIESKISKLIFVLPQYQESVLPSESKRKTSTNRFKDNQPRFS